MADFIQVVTTTAKQDLAIQIATELVERRLAACVQILGPITSTYRWDGQIETSQEWICVAKTQQKRYDEVEEAIRRRHDYDVPEIVATPITAGSKSYLEWLATEIEPEE